MRKILLVEDEKIVAYDIKMILSTMNRIVTRVASSGKEAIDMVAAERPDLILMDISLSGEYDGIQTAEFITRDHDIPLIYLTAFADEKTLERAKRTEPMGYLLKPFNETELKTNVEIALYKREIAERYREKELWLSSTLALAGLGIIKTTADDRVVFMNDVAETMCGAPLEECREKTLSDLCSFKDEGADASRPLAELYDQGQRVLELVNAGGAVFPVMFAAHTVEEIDTGRTRIYLLEDLTKKREAEQAIWSTRNLLEQTFHILHDALVIMDDQFRMIDVNPAAEKLFGYTRQALLGSPVFMLWKPHKDTTTNATEIERVLETRAFMRRHEMEMSKQNGERFPVEFTLAPLSKKDDSIYGWVLFVADSSERKMYERKLEMAKEQAEAANRAKSEFIANMSHELRTPLNSIIGMTDLTLETELTPDQRESLEIVRHSSHSFLQLLNTILDFSKIETGKIELEEIEFDLPGLVRDTMKVLKVQAMKKNLSFSTDIASDVPRWVIGDPLRLNQVLINLVGNAIKFTESGFTRLTITTDPEEENESRLLFRVEDSGIGIPPEKLSRIFDSFKQLDGSTTRKYGGTGLGLTIAKRLIELMNGEIWVSSVPEKGSVFSFALPYRKGKGAGSRKKPEKRKLPGGVALS
ncbi:MAG TPA: PAS domain S-box protein, partial [Spirochaetia bacterium]|nr:PAS domain S-box protein [Spirochaetia bacterium]